MSSTPNLFNRGSAPRALMGSTSSGHGHGIPSLLQATSGSGGHGHGASQQGTVSYNIKNVVHRTKSILFCMGFDFAFAPFMPTNR
jgi:hypothetical protein